MPTTPPGNRTSITEPLGWRAFFGYDDRANVIARTNALDEVTRWAFHPFFNKAVQQITPQPPDANGWTTWTNLYAYDAGGNLTNHSDALHGHYVMTYGPRNERTLERNQDNKEWRYAYDELLRLKRQTDPNGTTRTPKYDKAGRVLFIDFNTDRSDEFAYDANNNPQTLSRRVSGVTTATQFIYDALDRPIEQTDAFAQTVQYGYDPLGRVTALTYPGGKTLTNRYDALGRLTSQMDWAGRQMTYAYDQADRLIRRTYPNGVVQTNTFDNAGRLADLKYQISNPQSNSIAIALAYAYDKNGNKTGSSEKGTFPWPQPSMTDERADYTAAGRLKTRSITPSATNAIPSPGGEGQGEGGPNLQPIKYFYDPSGNMTNAVKTIGGTNAESWALAYDEDNRTTTLCWTMGALCDKIITNRYDALGRRLSRISDHEETRYVLSLVGGMERILCDMTSSGTVTAWYIHGPDLCYGVDTTNNLVCYHADALANIISLTGTNGINLAQYAYTPYGRSLGSAQSAISNFKFQIFNPFTFVGSQGVMEELPGLYFMRARYYSADAGVFLSTDPVKKIGPGWKAVAYGYANHNPLSHIDPQGTLFVNTLLSSPVTYSANITPLIGVAVEGSIGRDGIDPFKTKQTLGLSVGASESVEALGMYGGDDSDWEKYDKVDLSLKALAGVGFTVARSYTGKWGVSISGSVGLDVGIRASVTMSDPIVQAVRSSSSSSTSYQTTPAGTINGKPIVNPSLGSVNSGGVSAYNQATGANTSQAQPSASAGKQGGSTSSNSSTTYTVKAGDTLGNIGYKYGSTATAIGAASGIQNLNLIRPGQVLTIPRP